MSNYAFASMPSVSIARSKFLRTQPHNTSFNLGELVVLGIDEVIPGSTHKIELGSLIRMSTPIAPIMDDIQFDVFSFFVPMRLTWDHWKQFMGESDQAGIATVAYTIPGIKSAAASDHVDGSGVNTIADDLGIWPDEGSGLASPVGVNLSVLPFRAVKKIYNRWFRNQNVEAPIAVNTGDTVNSYDIADTGLVVRGGSLAHDGNNDKRLIAYKLPDYFTSSLPYAQKGDPVSIITDPLPVLASPTMRNTNSNATHYKNSSGVNQSGYIGLSTGLTHGYTITGISESDKGLAIADNLYANCVNTINDLRFAFQLQKALEKDALYGSRYWEVLRAHYAVTSPDATLQDPELLGHIKFDINISQVLQTTGFTDASNTNLGTPGANSVTGNKGHLFTASFVEHGYIIHIGVARQKRHTYSRGLNKMWMRETRFDFYHPVFANIGPQKVMMNEIFPSVAGGPLNLVFGYQEAWAEYRFLPGYNSGLLNPYRSNSLDYWTLADKYTSAPSLGPTFLKEDRGNLARALVTGVTGPDFIGSFFFKDTVVNPMPLYSIPGFADHH